MISSNSAYDFKYLQLSHDARPNAQPYIRISFLFKKRPEISYSQFFRYWETVHADLTVAIKAFGASNFLRYVQVCFASIAGNCELLLVNTGDLSFTRTRNGRGKPRQWVLENRYTMGALTFM